MHVQAHVMSRAGGEEFRRQLLAESKARAIGELETLNRELARYRDDAEAPAGLTKRFGEVETTLRTLDRAIRRHDAGVAAGELEGRCVGRIFRDRPAGSAASMTGRRGETPEEARRRRAFEFECWCERGW